ncbi:MAG: hypothetical protein WKG01_42725, partial [Kofleriaceae bacterium]
MSDDEELEEIEDDQIEDDQIEDVTQLAQVAASEAELVTLARAIVAGPAAGDDMWALLCRGRNLPKKIGPTCASLLEDAFEKVWLALWHRGGTRLRTSLTGVRGRLWDRYEPLPLTFTPASVHLIRWLVSTPFSAPPSTLPSLHAMPLALGDQVLVYLTLDAVRDTPAMRVIAAQPFVRSTPLAWLGFCADLAGAAVPTFDSLVTGAGPVVVEALAEELAKRWQATELAKRAQVDPAALIAVGEAQDRVLGGFMSACETVRRRDRAGFVIDAAAPLIERNLAPVPGRLDPGSPLSTRAQARLAAGSLLRAIVRWADWDLQHRSIRYIDDDYAIAPRML